MAVVIDHGKCCYAKGTCNCYPTSDNGKSDKFVIPVQQKYCVEAYPAGALSRNNDIIVDNSFRTDCGECIRVCYGYAITVKVKKE